MLEVVCDTLLKKNDIPRGYLTETFINLLIDELEQRPDKEYFNKLNEVIYTNYRSRILIPIEIFNRLNDIKEKLKQ